MDVLTYQGTVIKFKLFPETYSAGQGSGSTTYLQSVRLKAVSYRFSKRTQGFEEAQLSEPLAFENGNVGIVTCKCVVEQHTGLVLPCVIIQSQTLGGNFINSVVFFVPQSEKLFVFGNFASRIQFLNCENEGRTWLLDGPRVCWVEHGALNVAVKHQINQTFQVQQIGDYWWTEGTDLKYCCTEAGGLLILVHQRIATGTAGSDVGGNELCQSTWFSCIANFAGNVRGKLHLSQETSSTKLKEGSFLPHDYASITRCMHVCVSEPVACQDDKHQQISSSSLIVKNTTLIATSMKQLLEFRNGKLCKLSRIPFEDAMMIVSMVMGGEEMIGVRSAGGQVCVVRRSSFEVVQEWQNTSSLLMDDFLGSGRDQMLLLIDSPPVVKTQSFPEFILTDMGLCLITRDQLLADGMGTQEVEGCGLRDGFDSTTSVSVCPKNLMTAVHALEARVEHGMASLKEQELLCKQKDRIIRQSTQTLTEMASRRHSHVDRQPTLVHICGKETQTSGGIRGANVAHDITARLKVTSGWQRVIDDQWTVGFIVSNMGHVSVTDMYLSLLPVSSGSPTPHQSEGYIRHPLMSSVVMSETAAALSTTKGDVILQPPLKRIKLESHDKHDHLLKFRSASLHPGKSVDVVAMTTVPDFKYGPAFTCLLVLQWTCVAPSDKVASPAKQRNMQSKICGRLSLTVADVINNRLAVRLPHENLASDDTLSRADQLALDAAQLTTSMQVTSRYTQLTCLPSMLCHQMGFKEIGRGASRDGLCYTDGAMNRMRLYFHNVKSRSSQIRVCTRDRRQLMLFYHSAIANLPEDVQFRADFPTGGMEEAIADSISCINLELRHTQTLLDRTLHTRTAGMSQPEASQEGPTNEQLGKTANDGSGLGTDHAQLMHVRQEFSEQSSRRRGEKCEVAGDKLLPFRTRLLELRGKTDDAMAVLSERMNDGGQS